MKKLLIISPYFPPTNAADMHRIRMSLPYFRQFGWEPEVVTVQEKYADLIKDPLLEESIPEDIVVHRIAALNKKWTTKIGLGAIALRACWHYYKAVEKILRQQKFDLIYFSTTQFPVCALGPLWRKKFSIPYVIDFQDPWYSDHYDQLPRNQRPAKYWFAKRLNRYLEPIAMSAVSGLISVSKGYLDLLKHRYPMVSALPSRVITFSASIRDMEIARAHKAHFPPLLQEQYVNIVYIGVAGKDFYKAISPVFEVLSSASKHGDHSLERIRMYFIGTSYAPAQRGIPTIIPLAKQFGLETQVTESTDRIGFYHVLHTLQTADALFMPGSEDARYTPSKMYPYLLAEKPLMAIFNPGSPAMQSLAPFNLKHLYHYDQQTLETNIYRFFLEVIQGKQQIRHNSSTVFSAEEMTSQQCDLFNEVIQKCG